MAIVYFSESHYFRSKQYSNTQCNAMSNFKEEALASTLCGVSANYDVACKEESESETARRC